MPYLRLEESKMAKRTRSGRKVAEPKERFSPEGRKAVPAAGNAAAGAAQKATKKLKATAAESSKAKRALQAAEPEETIQEEAGLPEEESATVAGSSSAGTARAKTTVSAWDSLSSDLRLRMSKFVAFTQGEISDYREMDGEKIARLRAKASQYVNKKGCEETVEEMLLWEALQDGFGGSRRGGSSRGGFSRAASTVEVTGESFVAPLIPSAGAAVGVGSFAEVAPRTRAECALGGVGNGCEVQTGQVGNQGAAGKAPGVAKLLNEWNLQDAFLRDLVAALSARDQSKVQELMADHVVRPSVGLKGRPAHETTEYAFVKVCDGYLASIHTAMEKLEKDLSRAVVANPLEARFCIDAARGTPGDPAFWRAGVGADFISHVRGHGLLRMKVEREDPAGTWTRMHAKVTEHPELSAFGQKEREEAKKQAQKESKPPQQRKRGAAGRKSGVSGGAAKKAKTAPEASTTEQSPPAASSTLGVKCYACKAMGHRFWENKCAEGRKWIAERIKAGGGRAVT